MELNSPPPSNNIARSGTDPVDERLGVFPPYRAASQTSISLPKARSSVFPHVCPDDSRLQDIERFLLTMRDSGGGAGAALVSDPATSTADSVAMTPNFKLPGSSNQYPEHLGDDAVALTSTDVGPMGARQTREGSLSDMARVVRVLWDSAGPGNKDKLSFVTSDMPFRVHLTPVSVDDSMLTHGQGADAEADKAVSTLPDLVPINLPLEASTAYPVASSPETGCLDALSRPSDQLKSVACLAYRVEAVHSAVLDSDQTIQPGVGLNEVVPAQDLVRTLQGVGEAQVNYDAHEPRNEPSVAMPLARTDGGKTNSVATHERTTTSATPTDRHDAVASQPLGNDQVVHAKDPEFPLTTEPGVGLNEVVPAQVLVRTLQGVGEAQVIENDHEPRNERSLAMPLARTDGGETSNAATLGQMTAAAAATEHENASSLLTELKESDTGNGPRHEAERGATDIPVLVHEISSQDIPDAALVKLLDPHTAHPVSLSRSTAGPTGISGPVNDTDLPYETLDPAVVVPVEINLNPTLVTSHLAEKAPSQLESSVATSVVDQVRLAIKTLARRDLSDAVALTQDRVLTVPLSPEFVPGVEIQIRSTPSGFAVTLLATNPFAGAFLEAHQHQIRQVFDSRESIATAEWVDLESTGWFRRDPAHLLPPDQTPVVSPETMGKGRGQDSSHEEKHHHRQNKNPGDEGTVSVASPLTSSEELAAQFRLSLGLVNW
jgi:hypothetical protein